MVIVVVTVIVVVVVVVVVVIVGSSSAVRAKKEWRRRRDGGGCKDIQSDIQQRYCASNVKKRKNQKAVISREEKFTTPNSFFSNAGQENKEKRTYLYQTLKTCG